MSRNLDNRISKLELSIAAATPGFDWQGSKAYSALSAEARDRLHGYANRFSLAGLAGFSDEELKDLEQLVAPFAVEEMRDGGEQVRHH